MQVITSSEFILILLVLCRILPIIIFFPHASQIPMQVKLLLAISIAYFLTPYIENNWDNINIITYVSETFIGAVIGLSIYILFLSINTAASIMAAQSGLSNATFFDPASAHQENILTKFLSLLVITLFFVSDTYLIILSSIVDSYKVFSDQIIMHDLSYLIVYIIKSSFEIAIKISFPVMLIGSITYFAAGIVGKLIPNIQVFFIIMPLQICIGMIILFLTLGGTIFWFINSYNSIVTSYLLR